MILELDIGNSRAKWRLLDGAAQVCGCGQGLVEEWLQTGVPNEWLGGSVRRVRTASVVNEDAEHKLSRLLLDVLALSVEFARSEAISSGVTNAYRDPKMLGVDRWLALLAAYKRAANPVLVAQIGSALTIDVVDRSGLHRGGYIIPGPRLMQDSLRRDTQRVRFPEFTSLASPMFGRDTLSCVSSGIAAAQVGTILLARRQAEASLQENVCVFLAGGWSGEIGSCLKELGCADFELVPELVLDGLRWVLP